MDMSAFILALVLTQAGDAATTCAALRAGFVEANPLIGSSASCGRVIALKLATVAPLVLVAPKLAKRHPRLARAVLIVPTATAGVAVVLNLKTLRSR
jgi:hypothetical protein